MEKLERIIFYTLDKTIKTYRQFAQRRLLQNDLDVTIDQWLVLRTLADDPDISQLEIADRVFKDAASVTRIIDLLIKKGYLQRQAHEQDRRRFKLQLTREGKTLLKAVEKVSDQNRAIALAGIEDKSLQQMRDTLISIIDNCKKGE